MNREAIFSTLFELVWDDAVFKNAKATARILRHWSDVPPEERPALFQAQGGQTVMATAANGLPSKWMLAVTLYVYVSTDGVRSPGEILNPILDAITDKLMPNPMGTPQTLGGLVEWARIEGTIETSEGTLGTDEVAIIPVRILTA